MQSRLPVSFAALSLLLTPHLPAQTVSGRLIEQTGNHAIVGAFVVLVDPDSNELTRVLTGGAGRFSLRAPAPGRYALKSAMIGFRSTVTSFFDLTADQEIEVDFAIPAIPVTLPKILVEDTRTCSGPAAAGLEAATVWEEARKALSAVVWTERQGTLRHVLIEYVRELDPTTLEVRNRRQRVVRGVYTGSPFSTVAPERLASLGYIQRGDDGQFRYQAPDADVLLSEEFAHMHCFSVIRGEGDRSGFLGLAFEPDASREVADVEGVLWLDAVTAELRYLDYSYTRVPVGVEADNVGGRIEFEHLPSGPWIVRRWWIRMPVVGVRNRERSDFIRENYLVALKEDGGYVREITTLDGEPVTRHGVASLAGRVVDLGTGDVVPAAEVVLVGTEYSVRTDNRGHFGFGYLPEGTYRISYGANTLDVLGYVPPLVEVSLRIEEPQYVTLAIPPISRMWANLCPGRPARHVGIVSGFVRDSASLAPVRGAQVLVSRAGSGAVSAGAGAGAVVGETITDWAGHFRVCDIPGGEEYAVEARRAGSFAVHADTATVRVAAGDILRIDFVLPSVERSAGN